MSKYQTIYGLYFTRKDRSEGFTKFYLTEEAAQHRLINNFGYDKEWDIRLAEQMFEVSEDSHHDSGDYES